MEHEPSRLEIWFFFSVWHLLFLLVETDKYLTIFGSSKIESVSFISVNQVQLTVNDRAIWENRCWHRQIWSFRATCNGVWNLFHIQRDRKVIRRSKRSKCHSTSERNKCWTCPAKWSVDSRAGPISERSSKVRSGRTGPRRRRTPLTLPGTTKRSSPTSSPPFKVVCRHSLFFRARMEWKLSWEENKTEIVWYKEINWVFQSSFPRFSLSWFQLKSWGKRLKLYSGYVSRSIWDMRSPLEADVNVLGDDKTCAFALNRLSFSPA